MELVLGTAQFGMKYGVTNTNGKMSRERQRRVIDIAKAYGVTKLDTAATYGKSEENLGALGVGEFSISTKIPFINNYQAGDIAQYVDTSLQRLNVSKLDIVYLHDQRNICQKDLLSELVELKKIGKIGSIGASIYIKKGVNLDLDLFDVIQCQGNAIDRAYFELLNGAHVVFLRSVFLQGLLLSNVDNLPAFLRSEIPLLESWERYCRDVGHTKLEMSLYHSMAKGVDALVVGCSSDDEFEEIASSFERVKDITDVPYFRVSSANDFLIDPRRWPQ